MKRREFITLLGGALAVLPFGAHAQQAMPVVGFLRSASLAGAPHLVAAFRQGLQESGFVEGQNIVIELRSAEDRSERLPALAADLIRRPAAVIVGDSESALAVKAATTTVPIIFAAGGDPVDMNLVANLNRPGGNVTGISFFTAVLGAKRLELLRQFVPKATTIGVLVRPNSPATKKERSDVEAAALAIGRQHVILDVAIATSRQPSPRSFSSGSERCTSAAARS